MNVKLNLLFIEAVITKGVEHNGKGKTRRMVT